MNVNSKLKKDIANQVNEILGVGDICQASDLVLPPNPKFGDLSLPMFKFACHLKKDINETAKIMANKIKTDNLIAKAQALGPYVNFKINEEKFLPEVIKEILKQNKKYGQTDSQQGKTVMVEFAHPNTHKSFHIGHLRNIITGEAIVRILANVGYKIIRANYQGDIGLHIAKSLWGIFQLPAEFKTAKKADIQKKVEFLAKAYVLGNKAYEEDRKAQVEIKELNKKIYKQDKSIKEVYSTTRQWSLDYFSDIYKRMDSKFDRLYFESEVFDKGKEIVLNNVGKVFKKSDDAIIFEGEKYGLHNRVFVTSEGNATYEAKDLALAELQMKEYSPDKIIHVVGPEQTEYFRVIFKALESLNPETKNLEMHLPYGWVRLKKGKMSSRKGNVILGMWLLDQVKEKIKELVIKDEVYDKTSEAIALAAVKYAFLKSDLANTINFDIKESVSLSGDSGPYLLYTYARIQSILRKAEAKINHKDFATKKLTNKESSLVFKLSVWPEIALKASAQYEPALIARFLFELAKEFSEYYHQTSVLKAEKDLKKSRLVLVTSIAQVMSNGLYLLGIPVVDKM